MVWSRIDDGFLDHPKVLRAGEDAANLYLRALVWANKHLTDGEVPSEALRAITSKPGASKLAARLVSVGLWESIEGGWRIHDFAALNPSRADVEAKRVDLSRKRAEAGRNGGLRSAAAKQTPSKTEANAKQTDEQTGQQTDSKEPATRAKQTPSPVPTRPQPVPEGVVGRAQPAHASVRADARDSTGTPTEAPEPEAPPAPPSPHAAPPPAPPPRGLGAQRDDGEKLLAELLAHGAIVEPTIPEHDALCIALGQLRRPSLDRFEETFEAFAKAIATHEGRVLAWPYLAKYDTSRILTASWLRACRPERNEQSFDRLRDGFDTWRASDGRRVATAARAAAATLTEGPLVDLRALVDPTVATLVSSPTMEREANERMARYGLSPEELARVALLLSQPSTWWPESGAVRRDPPRHVTLDDLAGYRDREVSGYEWKPLGALVGRARADLAAVRAREQAIAASASQYTGPKPLTFSTPAASALTDPNACSPEERANIARNFRANLPVRRPAAPPVATRSRYDDLPTDDQLAADAKAVTHG